MSRARAVFGGVEFQKMHHVEVTDRPAIPGVASAQGADGLEARVGIIEVSVFCEPGKRTRLS